LEGHRQSRHEHFLAKRNNVWMAETARIARDILGANGITGLFHHAPHDEP
jgi:hypothetical protein